MSEPVVVPVASRDQKKFYGKLNRHDFSGQQLARADFRGASLTEANFKGSDLSFANFEGANCWGADFTDANLHRANFKDAILANAQFRAADLFGITITLSCDTFDTLHVERFWWAWIFVGTMMKGPDDVAADRLIALMGKERYVRYAEHFKHRVL